MSKLRLAVTVCSAEILGMAGFATFPALLPRFVEEWGLSNVEAGWISGMYYAGYLAGVPVLTSITDRYDPRRIVLASTALSGLAAVGFAVMASGAWSAAGLRFLAGVGLAGTYMPGLRLLSDRADGAVQSRLVALYTSSFSVGASLSYLLAGELAVVLGWRWAFALSALGSVAAFVLIAGGVPATPPSEVSRTRNVVRGLTAVLRTPGAMAFIVGYTAHMWELFGMRTWIVAFLAFSQGLHDGAAPWSPTRVAAMVNLVGLPASLLGNEIAVRFGRRSTIAVLMLSSAVLSSFIGFGASLPAVVVIALSLAYGVMTMSDSSSLTAGAVAEAPAGRRGATLAVHSTLGFTAAFVGPLAFGGVLDLVSRPLLAWGLAFATLGSVNLLGALAVTRLGRRRAGGADGETDDARL